MRRILTVAATAALAATAGLFASPSAAAQPSQACGSADPVSLVQTATGAVICLNTGQINGAIFLSLDQNTQAGYVVADGDSTNPDPLDGYIGLENGNPYDAGGAPALVGCADGDYVANGPNHVILALDGNAPTPPDPADPCLPDAPAAPPAPGLPSVPALPEVPALPTPGLPSPPV